MVKLSNTILAALLSTAIDSTAIVGDKHFSDLEIKITQSATVPKKLEEINKIREEVQEYLKRYLPSVISEVVLTAGYCEVPEPKLPIIFAPGAELIEAMELPYLFDNEKLNVPSIPTIEKEISKCINEEFKELKKLPEGHEAELPEGLKYGAVDFKIDIKETYVRVRFGNTIDLNEHTKGTERKFYTYHLEITVPSNVVKLQTAVNEYLKERAFAFPSKSKVLERRYDVEFRVADLDDLKYKDSKIIMIMDRKSDLKFIFAARGMGKVYSQLFCLSLLLYHFNCFFYFLRIT